MSLESLMAVGFERFERSAAIERLERLELSTAWMSDMPDVTREKMAVGARHRLSLRLYVFAQKSCC